MVIILYINFNLEFIVSADITKVVSTLPQTTVITETGPSIYLEEL